MITFSTESKPLILKPIELKKFCSICVKDAADLEAQWCPDCLHPYDNNESLTDFDYDDYRQYSGVNPEKARLFFIANTILHQCRFCKSDPLLQSKTVHLYDRYYAGEFKDAVKAEADRLRVDAVLATRLLSTGKEEIYQPPSISTMPSDYARSLDLYFYGFDAQSAYP
ncbi:MAG: hypothetical protein HGB35_09225 [Geobacteraceae bacterium]|nr:hypothetical protein [Geobacteraceae bacterium]